MNAVINTNLTEFLPSEYTPPSTRTRRYRRKSARYNPKKSDQIVRQDKTRQAKKKEGFFSVEFV